MLRQMPIRTGSSFEQFLEFEASSQVRHEFVDGNLFVMSGGTDRHNHLVNRLIVRLFDVAAQAGAVLHQSDVLLQTPDGKGYYPDVFVLFDASLDTPRVKLRPNIIIEVLSDSTEAIDRGEKWRAYRRIPSLEQYVLLSQHEPVAEVFFRAENEWHNKELLDTQILAFPSLKTEFPLSSLYLGLPKL